MIFISLHGVKKPTLKTINEDQSTTLKIEAIDENGNACTLCLSGGEDLELEPKEIMDYEQL